MNFTRFGVILEAFAILVSFAIYFYTSKALNLGQSVFGKVGMTYFDFIVSAEIALIIPLYFFEYPVRNLKEIIDTKVFNTHILLGRSKIIDLIPIFGMDFSRIFLRIFLSVLIVSFFSSSINYFNWRYLLALVLCLPFLICVPLISICILLRFGRGANVIGYINLAVTVFSGAFFPIETINPNLSKFTDILLPTANLVSVLRENQELSNSYMLGFFLWLFLCVTFTYLYKYSLKEYCERGLQISRF